MEERFEKVVKAAIEQRNEELSRFRAEREAVRREAEKSANRFEAVVIALIVVAVASLVFMSLC